MSKILQFFNSYRTLVDANFVLSSGAKVYNNKVASGSATLVDAQISIYFMSTSLFGRFDADFAVHITKKEFYRMNSSNLYIFLSS